MVVVFCLILCSKFAKTRLLAGLCASPLGELTALHRPYPGREVKGEMEGQGQDGRKRNVEEEAGEKEGGKDVGGKGKGVSPSE